MARTLLLVAALVALVGTAQAVTLTGTAHIDYQPEGVSGQFCCDTSATYSLEWAPGVAYLNSFAILDYQNIPVWSASGVALSLTSEPSGEVVAFGGVDYLRLDNFPGFEATINPDNGVDVYTDFGPSFIALPSLGSTAVPEPASLMLLAGCMGCVILKR